MNNLIINFNHPIFRFTKYERFVNSLFYKIFEAVVLIISFFLLFLFLKGNLQPLFFIFLPIPLVVFLFDAFTRFKLNNLFPLLSPADASKLLDQNQTVDFFSLINLETASLFEKGHSLPELLNQLFKTKEFDFVLKRAGISKKDFIDNILQYNIVSDIQALAQKALNFAALNNKKKVDSLDLVFAFLTDTQNFLEPYKLTLEDISQILKWYQLGEERKKKKFFTDDKLIVRGGGIAYDWVAGYTPFLNQVGIDLTKAAKKQLLSFSALEREYVLDEMERALSKSLNKSALLIGEPGVGRTALTYQFAEKVLNGQILPELAFKRIVLLDLARVLSGAISHGDIERRFVNLLDEATIAGNIIIFIEGVHNIFDGEKPGTIEISEILLPYLQKGRVLIIGSTNYDAFHRYIETKSVAPLFEKIEVRETTPEETVRILEDISYLFEKKYPLFITYQSLKTVVELAEKYITGRAFPAKAIDLLEQSLNFAYKSGKQYLSSEDVIEVVTQKTKIPVGEATNLEKEVLLNLEVLLHQKMIDQEEAVKAVSDALRRVRSGLKEFKKAAGSFLFLGPTGVGKTQLSKALAWAYFGSEETMIRLDMSEYQDTSGVAKIIGPSPGARGAEAGGILTRKVKENPFSLILLDEVEKAHPDILNLFLQVLDEGYLTDGLGRKIDFRHSIIIATSNAGANMIREKVKEGVDIGSIKGEILDFLQKEGIFKPEFLNRFDGIILFKPLTVQELVEIAGLMVKEVQVQLKEKGIELEVSSEALEVLAQQGFDPASGARPMKRVIQEKLENPLSIKILKGEIQKGQKIIINKENVL